MYEYLKEIVAEVKDAYLRDQKTFEEEYYSFPEGTFPASAQDRTNYAIAFAIKLIAEREKICRAYPIDISSFESIEAKYMWTALMLLGEVLSPGFGNESIVSNRSAINPKNESGWIDRFGNQSLFETNFKVHINKDMIWSFLAKSSAEKKSVVIAEEKRVLEVQAELQLKYTSIDFYIFPKDKPLYPESKSPAMQIYTTRTWYLGHRPSKYIHEYFDFANGSIDEFIPAPLTNYDLAENRLKHQGAFLFRLRYEVAFADGYFKPVTLADKKNHKMKRRSPNYEKAFEFNKASFLPMDGVVTKNSKFYESDLHYTYTPGPEDCAWIEQSNERYSMYLIQQRRIEEYRITEAKERAELQRKNAEEKAKKIREEQRSAEEKEKSKMKIVGDEILQNWQTAIANSPLAGAWQISYSTNQKFKLFINFDIQNRHQPHKMKQDLTKALSDAKEEAKNINHRDRLACLNELSLHTIVTTNIVLEILSVTKINHQILCEAVVSFYILQAQVLPPQSESLIKSNNLRQQLTELNQLMRHMGARLKQIDNRQATELQLQANEAITNFGQFPLSAEEINGMSAEIQELSSYTQELTAASTSSNGQMLASNLNQLITSLTQHHTFQSSPLTSDQQKEQNEQKEPLKHFEQQIIADNKENKEVPERQYPVITSAGDIHCSIQIPIQEIKKGDWVGEGEFGVVYQGNWKNINVALKQLKNTRFTSAAKTEFAQEAAIMASIRHPHVVQLYGITEGVIDSQNQPSPIPKYTLVMEYCINGSLYQLIHNRQPLSWKLRLQIATDIANGVWHLHDSQIVHCDLKSLNILLDDRMRAKVSDFGLSKVKKETRSLSSHSGKPVGGSTFWMAPELFNFDAISTMSSDVYAMGMIFWEMAARKIPFANAATTDIAIGWITSGKQQPIPSDTPQNFAELICSLWNKDPSKRPDSKTIAQEMAQSCAKLSPD